MGTSLRISTGLIAAFAVTGAVFLLIRPDSMRPMLTTYGLLPKASSLVELSMERMPAVSERVVDLTFALHNAGPESRGIHYVVSAVGEGTGTVILRDASVQLTPGGVKVINERFDVSRVRLPATVYVRLPELNEYIHVRIPHEP